MSDWTDGERSKILGLLNMPMEEEWRIPEDVEIADVANLADSWDWRDHGAVTPVKDQGQCGSCWTYGATGDIEGTWFLAGNDLIALSEQQLTSCDRVGGDDGCRGGDSDLDTFKYVVKTGGICSEKQYPQSTWSSKFAISGKCDKSKLHDFAAKISGGVQISGGKTMPKNATAVMEAIYRSGPVTAAINSKYMDDYTK